jgi:hypothetical protein
MGIATAVAVGFVPEFAKFQQFKVAVILCKFAASLTRLVSEFDFLRACLRISRGYTNYSNFGYVFGASKESSFSSGAEPSIQRTQKTGFATTDTQVDRIIRRKFVASSRSCRTYFIA